jgi:DNA mismatch endonuclease (patch repair protein)
MSRIRGKHTTPEKVVRSLLRRLGYRFRLHVRIPITAKDAKRTKLVGHKRTQRTQKRFPLRLERGEGQGEVSKKSTLRPLVVCPDIILPKHCVAIFVHGCFWHRHRGCKNCTTPTHRRDWWLKKLNGNTARDKLHQRTLRKLGWRPMVIWECETEKLENLARLQTRLEQTLSAASACVPHGGTKDGLAQISGSHVRTKSQRIWNVSVGNSRN